MASRHDWLVLLGFLGLCFLVAGIGSWVTTPVLGQWYATLHKPSWTPPNWLFGPVWSALYGSMALAAWLVWRQRHVVAVTTPLVLFSVQLALNLVWSLVFFGLQNPGAAVIEILLLWASITTTLVAFSRVTPVAGWLFAPYLGWVTYAVALNFTIWRMNA